MGIVLPRRAKSESVTFSACGKNPEWHTGSLQSPDRKWVFSWKRTKTKCGNLVAGSRWRSSRGADKWVRPERLYVCGVVDDGDDVLHPPDDGDSINILLAAAFSGRPTATV